MNISCIFNNNCDNKIIQAILKHQTFFFRIGRVMWKSQYCNLGLEIVIDFFKLNINVQDYFENKKSRAKIGTSSNSSELDEKKKIAFLFIEKKDAQNKYLFPLQ